MARTHVEADEADPHVKAAAPARATMNGNAVAPAAERQRAQKAYQLTDSHGRRAYVWRDEGKWVVEADDSGFRRRILQGLKKPIWSIEDELDEFGVRWSTRVHLQPEDPRYVNRVLWSWTQIGLDDVEVRVVRRHDRQVMWPTPEIKD
jgi:hypothetical protein